MSYKPVQQKVNSRNSVDPEFANTWKQAVIGNRHAQQVLLQRITRNGARASR
jgi:hypothetical protein